MKIVLSFYSILILFLKLCDCVIEYPNSKTGLNEKLYEKYYSNFKKW